jgi:hypothetical protein
VPRSSFCLNSEGHLSEIDGGGGANGGGNDGGDGASIVHMSNFTADATGGGTIGGVVWWGERGGGGPLLQPKHGNMLFDEPPPEGTDCVAPGVTFAPDIDVIVRTAPRDRLRGQWNAGARQTRPGWRRSSLELFQRNVSSKTTARMVLTDDQAYAV